MMDACCFKKKLNPLIGVLGILERNKNKTKQKNDCQGTDSTVTRLE